LERSTPTASLRDSRNQVWLKNLRLTERDNFFVQYTAQGSNERWGKTLFSISDICDMTDGNCHSMAQIWGSSCLLLVGRASLIDQTTISFPNPSKTKLHRCSSGLLCTYYLLFTNLPRFLHAVSSSVSRQTRVNYVSALLAYDWHIVPGLI